MRLTKFSWYLDFEFYILKVHMGEHYLSGKYAHSVSLFVHFHGDLESQWAMWEPNTTFWCLTWTNPLLSLVNLSTFLALWWLSLTPGQLKKLTKSDMESVYFPDRKCPPIWFAKTDLFSFSTFISCYVIINVVTSRQPLGISNLTTITFYKSNQYKQKSIGQINSIQKKKQGKYFGRTNKCNHNGKSNESWHQKTLHHRVDDVLYI